MTSAPRSTTSLFTLNDASHHSSPTAGGFHLPQADFIRRRRISSRSDFIPPFAISKRDFICHRQMIATWRSDTPSHARYLLRRYASCTAGFHSLQNEKVPLWVALFHFTNLHRKFISRTKGAFQDGCAVISRLQSNPLSPPSNHQIFIILKSCTKIPTNFPQNPTFTPHFLHYTKNITKIRNPTVFAPFSVLHYWQSKKRGVFL